MKCAVIDIGSNSMRLTVYDAERHSFRILFKEKIMTALAGYTEKGRLSGEGIAAACGGLLEFRERLEVLEISDIYVFATASLRNISNTQEALSEILRTTGFSVEVVSGEEEAIFGFTGAMADISLEEGVFVDIGGASTEISAFCGGEVRGAFSFPTGSLKLYKECVSEILPGKREFHRMEKQIRKEIGEDAFSCCPQSGRIVCIGGTARAVLKLARRMFSLSAAENSIDAVQFQTLCSRIFRADREACDLILKSAPERIHTLIPGMSILKYIVEKSGASGITVSKHSVREGYLCQKIQKEM